jgi:type IV pilus assembly protein PilQ
MKFNYLFFTILFLSLSSILYAQNAGNISFPTNQNSINSPDSLINTTIRYDEAVKSFQLGDYSGAMALFSSVQAADPQYHKSEVEHYIKDCESKLGYTSAMPVFKVAGQQTKTFEITRENQLQTLAEAAQNAILNTVDLLDSIKKQGNIPDFDLLTPESNLQMAEQAYNKDAYTTVIRLANKARYQLIGVLNRKKMGIFLGKIGNVPVKEFNASNLDVRSAIKILADTVNENHPNHPINIVISNGVSGRVTMTVHNLTLQQVLDQICKSDNLRYVKEKDGVVMIMTDSEFKHSSYYVNAVERKVYPIYFGDAKSIVRSLKETFPSTTIIYEPRTNSIIVNTSDSKLATQIADVISSLDTPVSEVMLQAELVEFKASTNNTFGMNWLISSHYLTPISGTLTGPQFGTNPTFTAGNSATLNQTNSPNFSFGITNSQINMLVSALSTKGKTNILQAPKIMCLNGSSAALNVVQNVPYLIPVSTVSQQQYTVSTAASFSVYNDVVGTQFLVTPIIQKNGEVFLTLNIINSSLVEIEPLSATVAGQSYSTEQPVIATESTSQNIVVYDGQTLVIGGMINNSKQINNTGIPFLDRIPILKYLFSSPSETNNKDELLLFLTPKIVTTYYGAGNLTNPDLQKQHQYHNRLNGGLLDKF